MHIIFVTLLCVSSTMFCSAPQQRNFPSHDNIIENIGTRRVAIVHNRISPFVTNTSITQISGPIQGELFFACLPQELRIRTLSQNFFNGDTQAAEDLEEKPYAWSLYLLAEYQQKPKPYLHLQPKWILLLSNEQVAVVNEIERQYIEAQQNPPAAPALQPWFFLNQKPADAKLNHKQKQILNTIPSQALEKSLDGKLIHYSDAWQTIPNIAKDTCKSLLFDVRSYETIAHITCIATLTCPLGTAGEIVRNHGFFNLPPKESSMIWNMNGILCIDLGLMVGLYMNSIPLPFHDVFTSWLSLRIAFDCATFGCVAIKYGTLPKIFYSTTIMPLCIGVIGTAAEILYSRGKASYANQYVIKSKKQKMRSLCALV